MKGKTVILTFTAAECGEYHSLGKYYEGIETLEEAVNAIRIFRKFGLSGKSFIPMLIGTGYGIPGIMASRTIENERDRRMTITTTTFIPCGAKVPFISMVAGAIFGGSAWVATSAYFVGVAAIIISSIMLKKTKMFSGDPAPFVMELPAYHMPTAGNVLRSMRAGMGRQYLFLHKERYDHYD